MTSSIDRQLEEARSRVTALATEIEELSTLDEPTEEQVQRLDAAIAEAPEARAAFEAAETRQREVTEIRNAANRPGHTEDGATRRPLNGGGDDTRAMFEGVAELESRAYYDRGAATELRTRAVSVIEEMRAEHFTDNMRETATRHAERNPLIAAHILRTGSPEYHEAFEDYMRGDFTAANRFPGEARAAMSLTGANGGFLVPFTLDPTIILTNNGAENPFREISTVKTITTDDWNGVTSAGVTAEWLAEAAEAADASPTFAQPSITVHKAAAYLQASIEVTMDSNIASDVAMLIRDAKDRLEATAFATGSGSGQPYGIVTELQLVTASRVAGSSGAAGAADFVAADIYAVDNALPPRHRNNSPVWVAEHSTYNRIRQFATGSGPQHAFWTDFGGGQPPSLIGYSAYNASAMDSTIVSGSNDDILVLGDFKDGYYIIDRVGLAIAYNPLVIGSNRRPTGEVGWFAYWRVGARAVNPNAFRMLRV